ncbi:Lpg0189 family type II secretion system effector [Legionella genomosp. 1]|uniref:Lpg0189 family type II secretion system effector n=1 Tax=Legionella genomosp. 1 TaxID=1093625 RepID=UPI0010542ACD|nr:Lpg0189 family type II secretion system effector [Legionella genomosp. 1]
MKFRLFYAALLLSPLSAFADEVPENQPVIPAANAAPENTVVRQYTTEDKTADLASFQRSIDYPTQIVRIKGSLADKNLSCDEVNKAIDKAMVSKITPDKFTYNIYISCSYDPQTRLATSFLINTYFDPLSDNAIDYLNNYLAEYNGSDLLGTSFNIESAKGVVISMNLNAGYKNNMRKTTYTLYHQDRGNYFFKSNYDLKKELIADIYNRFYSNDPEVVLPFLDKWISPYASSIYPGILRSSNYVELQPERIFVMDHEGDLFVSNLKYYFAHTCTKYTNKRCM